MNPDNSAVAMLPSADVVRLYELRLAKAIAKIEALEQENTELREKLRVKR